MKKTIETIANSDLVVFFSKTDCKYCDMLERDLRAMDVPYKKVMLNETDLRDDLIESTGVKTVPQLFIAGKFIGGYSEFTKLCTTSPVFSNFAFYKLMSSHGIVPSDDF